MINRIRINNFRSVREIELELGPLNIVFGPNGLRKNRISTKAIHLLTASANGQFSSYVSEEGGLENIMWSGKQAPTDRHPRRLQIACLTDEFEYELQVGFPEKNCRIRRNSCSIRSLKKRISGCRALTAGHHRVYCSGKKPGGVPRSMSMVKKSTFTDTIYEKRVYFSASLASRIVFPEVSRVRETMRRWRFYHEFAIGRLFTAAPADGRLPFAGAR